MLQCLIEMPHCLFRRTSHSSWTSHKSMVQCLIGMHHCLFRRTSHSSWTSHSNHCSRHVEEQDISYLVHLEQKRQYWKHRKQFDCRGVVPLEGIRRSPHRLL